jgi:hypothetical protein
MLSRKRSKVPARRSGPRKLGLTIDKDDGRCRNRGTVEACAVEVHSAEQHRTRCRVPIEWNWNGGNKQRLTAESDIGGPLVADAAARVLNEELADAQ